MPIIKSAIKKQRQDKKREKQNDTFRAILQDSIKKAQKTKVKKEIVLAASLLDKAVKKHLIHKNKAARIKSRLTSSRVKVIAAVKKTAVKKTKIKTIKKTKKK